MSSDDQWAASFPALFASRYVAYAGCRVGFTTMPVPDELVGRLHVVGKTPAGQVIVCRSSQGWRFLPGGTREDGETLVELAHRELLEEAGARITGEVAMFASHIADSVHDRPYRPHLPHPRAYWGYACATVEIVQPPTNPPDGEHVVEVRALPPDAAASYLAEHDQTHADIVRLAVAMGSW